jgi:hypothetical protein
VAAILIVFVALPTMKAMFPTHCLTIQKAYGSPNKDVSNSSEENKDPEAIEDGIHYNLCGAVNSTIVEEDDLHEAFDSLAKAYYGLQRQFEERLSSLSSMYERQ